MLSLNSRFSAFILLFLATMLFVFLAFYLSVGLAIIVSLVAVIFAYFGTPLWRSGGDPQSRVRILALMLLATATAPILSPSWLPDIANRLIGYFNNLWKLSIPQMPTEQTGIGQIAIYLIFTIAVAIIATKYSRTTVMTRKSFHTPLKLDQAFNLGFTKFVRLWGARLDSLDRELNWTDEDFVALEAEVETKLRRSLGRNVSLLIEALREVAMAKKADRPVIILGEPGSGKSVALRRLCRTLLGESQSTGQLPVYVNLKGWKAPSSWNSDIKPRALDLQAFIKSAILSEANDYFAERFITEYFERMILEGRFFFIFDSFDEIPLVMDNQENSWAIDAVSKCLNNFLQGAHSSQGIVASRYFKKPTDALGAGTIYRIRPFDETRVREILRTVGGRDEAAILDAFRTKGAILRSATNPMIANLLASYVRERNGRWPENTFELYRDYIDRRLEDRIIDQKLRELGLTRTELIESSAKIAQFMVDSDSNTLNVSLEDLEAIGEPEKISATVAVLKFIRLGRHTSSDVSSFSFSHRRFQEFFVVSSMTGRQVETALNAIQSDNRYRDILALYCETATSEGMNRVAAHAIHLLDSLNAEDIHLDVEALRSAVQVLRFISDAFKTRPDVSFEFIEALKKYVTPIFNAKSKREFYPLLAKFSAEALGVLPDFGTTGPLGSALKYPNQYVRETAFRASRHIVPVPESLKTFVDYEIVKLRYLSLTGSGLFKRYSDLMFSMSLSSGLQKERLILFAWVLDVLLLPLTVTLFFCISPILITVYMYALSKFSKGNHPTEWLWACRFMSSIAVLPLFIAVTLVVAAYLQYNGMSWAQVQESDILRNVFAFPLPFEFSRGLFSTFPIAIALPLLLVLTVNIIVPVAPVIFGWSWDVSHPQRVKRRPKVEKSKSMGLKDFREAWVASCEASRKRRLEAPPRTAEPLTFAGYLIVGMIVIIGSLAGFLWYEFGIAAAVTFLGLSVLLLTVIAVIPSVAGRAMKSVSSAMNDASVFSKIHFSDRMDRESIEVVLKSLLLARSRRRYLDEIANRHVLVQGKWKEPWELFKPDDSVADKLVRLEERWLRLDD